MDLIKYCTTDVAKLILSKRKLRFTPPVEFNDPFELHPHLGALISTETLSVARQRIPEDDLNKQILQAVGIELDKLPDAMKVMLKSEDISNLLSQLAQSPELKEVVFLLIKTIIEQLNQDFSPSFIKGLQKNIGILCLAGNSTSELMWAHYANAHTGACLVFDGKHDFFQQSRHPGHRVRSLTKVAYSQERPCFSDITAMISESDDEESLIRKLFFTKSSVWGYEEEERCIRLLEEANEIVKAADGTLLHLFEFPSDALQGVVFGSRCSEGDIDDIVKIAKKMLANRDYPPFAKIALDKKRYELRPELILRN